MAPWLTWSIERRKPVNVLDFLERSAVVPNLKGTTRWEVIDELCRRLTTGSGEPAADTILAAVRAREALFGTGIGNDVAIPHARLADLRRPLLVFGRSITGVDWDTPDGLPVHLVFLLVTPEQERGLQVQILAAIARGLGNRAMRDRLVKAESDGEVWALLAEALRSQKPAGVTQS